MICSMLPSAIAWIGLEGTIPTNTSTSGGALAATKSASPANSTPEPGLMATATSRATVIASAVVAR